MRVVFARVKYRVEPDTSPADAAPATISTAELPPQMIARSLATPSLLAHVISDKLCDGLPLHRQEDRFARLGVTLDRGTMSRWQQDVGLTVGATMVEAMRADAIRHEVGCWSHARRKMWEAAITKDVVAREGLARIARIFALDRRSASSTARNFATCSSNASRVVGSTSSMHLL